MAQFTPAQTAAIHVAVKGQCETMERLNRWRFCFGEAPRRGQSFHHLLSRGAAAAGAELKDLTPADVQELTGLVLALVQEYDRRNHIAPAV